MVRLPTSRLNTLLVGPMYGGAAGAVGVAVDDDADTNVNDDVDWLGGGSIGPIVVDALVAAGLPARGNEVWRSSLRRWRGDVECGMCEGWYCCWCGDGSNADGSADGGADGSADGSTDGSTDGSGNVVDGGRSAVTSPPPRRSYCSSATVLYSRSCCSCRWATWAAMVRNSSLSRKLLGQQFCAYRQSSRRWPHRWHGVSPLHLILRRLHSLLLHVRNVRRVRMSDRGVCSTSKIC